MNRLKKLKILFSFTNKNTAFILIIIFCFLFLFLDPIMTAYADMIKTFTPKIRVFRTYRDMTDIAFKDSYWTTEISPGLSLVLSSPKTQLNLNYDIGFSSVQNRNEYSDDTEDSTAHSLTAGWIELLDRNVKFEISDTFTRSENPIMTYDEQVKNVLRKRQIYTQNTGHATLTWQFGSEDQLSLGYLNRYFDINNKFSEYEDSIGHEGFLILDKRLNPKFSFGFLTRINRGKFKQQGEPSVEDTEDFYNYEGELTINYRWRPTRSFFIKYGSLRKDFDKYDNTAETVDFWVHQASIGLNLMLSLRTDLNVEGGFFVKNPSIGKNNEGGTFSTSLTTRKNDNSFTLTGSGGFKEDYFSLENLGSSKFQSVFGIVQYTLTKYLKINVFSGYNWDDIPSDDRKLETHQIGTVFALNLKHRLTLDVEFLHWAKKDKTSDNQIEDIKITRNNFIIITLHWNYPFSF